MRTLLLLVLFNLRGVAQIQDLATTDDGQQLYFSSSYRLRGTAERGYLKIFRYVAEGGFQLFRQLELLINPGLDTNFFQAERPSISGDGRVLAYTASRNCFGGSHCIGFIYYQGWVAGLGGPDRNVESGTLSPDGRYVLGLSPDGRYVLGLAPPGLGATLSVPAWINLSQPAITSLEGFSVIGDGRQALGNGGVALLADAQGPLLWNRGNIQRLSFTGAPVQGRLSNAADKIVYEAAPAGGNYELHSYEVATSRDLILTTGAQAGFTSFGNTASYFHPSLVNDGSLVAYVLNQKLMLQAMDGSNLRQIATAPEGIKEAVISGYGNLAYAVTATDRLLRVDISSGTDTELSSAVPHIQIVGGALVPGGRLDLSVTNAPKNSDPAILGPGVPAPIIGRSADAVTLQVPWEAAVGSTVKLAVPANPSAFEEAHDNRLAVGIPEFYTLPLPGDIFPPYALAAHQDFRSIVTDSSPAKPGEVVHLFFTGLGAVAPRIATGAVTPVGTLFRLQTPFACQFFQQGSQLMDANILFAGLAPGFVGVEQVDLQIPASGITRTHPGIKCVSGQPVEASSGFAQIPVQP